MQNKNLAVHSQNYTSLSFLCCVTKDMSVSLLGHLCRKRLPPTKPFMAMFQITQYVTNKFPQFMSSATHSHWEMHSWVFNKFTKESTTIHPRKHHMCVCVDSGSPLWVLKYDGLRSRPGSGPSRPFTGMSRDTLRRVSSLLFICKSGWYLFSRFRLCVCVCVFLCYVI